MKQGGFASIIKAQEQDLGFFLPQTKWCQHPIKPINQKHYFSKKRTFKASSFDLLTKTGGGRERERERENKLKSEECVSLHGDTDCALYVIA